MASGGAEIAASNITYIIPSPRTISFFPGNGSAPRRQVLSNVSCRALPGQILAVVGPSGAGKSTLLQILAGRKSPSTPAAGMTINGAPADIAALRRVSAYVTQKDMLFPLLTVRETLAFSAQLRLSGDDGDRSSRVDQLLKELGLARVADSRVAVLSGGERRRVSIGVEAVHDPAVLIMDEPTSGLDSSSAAQVVGILHAMAVAKNRTVIISIHQPGARVAAMFGSVLLLAGGAVVNHGLTISPSLAGAIECAIDEANSKRQAVAAAPPPHEHCTLRMLFQQCKVSDDDGDTAAAVAAEKPAGGRPAPHYANSHAGEVAILARRFMKSVVRTRQLFLCRTVAMAAAGVVLGSIFYRLGDDKLAERVGLFAFILTFLLSSTTEALPVFLQEREILFRETSSCSYRISSYVVANAVVFLPFLAVLAALFAAPLYWLAGLRATAPAFAYFTLLVLLVLYTANSVVVFFAAAAPDFIVGNAGISGLMGSFFLFSGYFIEPSAMPGGWVFMHYLSLFRWPFEAFLVNEFGGGRCVVRELGACVATGSELLRQQGLGEECRWRNVGVIAAFIFLYRFLCYLVLKIRCSYHNS